MLTEVGQILNRDFTNSFEFDVSAAQAQFEALTRFVTKAAAEGVAAHVVERDLFAGLLQLGATLFGGFLKQVGPSDVGETANLDDGRVVSRLEEQHVRRLLTVFGSFDVSRWVYAQRDGQKIELAPTDQRLQLPESELSYLLQEWDQSLGIEHAFGKVRDTITDILNLKQSMDTLQRNNQQMAETVLEFHESKPPVNAAEEGAFLVVTEDNKGIPMVRTPEEKPVGACRKKGEKANKKQMACIGCVYSVDPHVRTSHEMVATLFRDPDRPQSKPPEAKQKRYWAELTHQDGDITLRGQELVFLHMGDEVERRRLPGQMLVHLCDGQKSLETDRKNYLPTDENTVDVLDLMHVIPRLWDAAHAFYEEHSKEAVAMVRERLLQVLSGDLASVVHGLRYMGTVRGLKGAKLHQLSKACNFLKNNEHRTHYDEYLKAGYPIATGVIEGACRHVIKDRMERAGMRWKLPGARAMLQLRAVSASGEWKQYMQFRIESENQRLYPNKRAFKNIDWAHTLAV